MYKEREFGIFLNITYIILKFSKEMKVIKKKFMSLFVALVLWVGSVNVLLAQGGGAADVDQIPGYGADLIGWIIAMLQWLIALAGVVAAAVLIMNGFMYITASGDEGKIQKATKGITYAIIGLIIAAIAFLIVNFVANQLADVEVDSMGDLDRKIEFVV